MRALLDENLLHKLRQLFADDVEVVTVGYRGWEGGETALFRMLNRYRQRRSYNGKGFEELIRVFKLERSRICHDF